MLYRGKLFISGGEGTNRVFGQMEAYDPASDGWEQYAPMLPPMTSVMTIAPLGIGRLALNGLSGDLADE